MIYREIFYAFLRVGFDMGVCLFVVVSEFLVLCSSSDRLLAEMYKNQYIQSFLPISRNPFFSGTGSGI